MSPKKYQVFISSTYEDLKEERRAVEQTIIRAGDIPVGMEAFPAADEEQFEFIKTIISQCDYYVLIIAGRYGSLACDGKSYTEKEFDYAIEIGVPVLVMLRDNRGELAASKTENDTEKCAKLENFIAVASEGRIRSSWTTTDGLKLEVREALDHAKATKHRPGWIRGDQSSSHETLEKLVAAQEEIDSLKQALEQANPQIKAPENLAGLDAHIILTGTYIGTPNGGSHISNQRFSIGTNLGEVFGLLAPHLMLPREDNFVQTLVAECVWRRYNPRDVDSSDFSTTDEIFQTIKVQLMALGLVDVRIRDIMIGEENLFWSLTEKGNHEMVRRRAMVS